VGLVREPADLAVRSISSNCGPICQIAAVAHAMRRVEIIFRQRILPQLIATSQRGVAEQQLSTSEIPTSSTIRPDAAARSMPIMGRTTRPYTPDDNMIRVSNIRRLEMATIPIADLDDDRTSIPTLLADATIAVNRDFDTDRSKKPDHEYGKCAKKKRTELVLALMEPGKANRSKRP